MKERVKKTANPSAAFPEPHPKALKAKLAPPAFPRIGVHVSAAGGLETAFANAEAMGCDCMQIFVKNQRQWQAKPLSDEQVRAFLETKRKSAIFPITAHASYLLNLAAPSEAVRTKSIDAMVDELSRCEALEVESLVFHPGAHLDGEVRNPFGFDDQEDQKPRPRSSKATKKNEIGPKNAEIGGHVLAGIERIASGMDEAHRRCAGFRSKLLLECTAGQGSAIGWQFEQLAEILKRVRETERVGVCLDTCHLFAAGYDFRTLDGYAEMIDRLDRTVGVSRVMCIHANDSKREMGSRVDRHEHIGKGQIGTAGFAHFLNDPRFREVPLILETPKEEDEKGRDMDQVNVEVLRSLASGARISK